MRAVPSPRVLDLGCGNGALLSSLSARVESGVGVDVSAQMIEHAKVRNEGKSHLSFRKVDGPAVPFEDASFDVVISLLSFRYLDWDPIMAEVRRVLRGNGRLLVVDMVELPARFRDSYLVAKSAAQHLVQRLIQRQFTHDVTVLTKHPQWQSMLKHNPIRAEHEYRWYFESRFPMRKLETLNVSRRHRIVAFDSGPMSEGVISPLTFP